jgi:hypothetical protein
MLAPTLHRVHDLADAAVRALRRRLGSALRPATTSSLVLDTAADLVRSKTEPVAENALLRHQLIVLARSTKRPRISRSDRALLVLLASRVRAWRQALLIVQPAAHPRARELGVRLPAADRPALPARVRVLHRRAGIPAGGPRRRRPRRPTRAPLSSSAKRRRRAPDPGS